MKKWLMVLLVASGLVFSGCGGGSGGEEDKQKTTEASAEILDSGSDDVGDKQEMQDSNTSSIIIENSKDSPYDDAGDKQEIQDSNTSSVIIENSKDSPYIVTKETYAEYREKYFVNEQGEYETTAEYTNRLDTKLSDIEYTKFYMEVDNHAINYDADSEIGRVTVFFNLKRV